MLDVLGPRPADLIVSRTVRITLGGIPYELPVRSIRANREWKERLDAATAVLLENLNASGDERAAIVAAFDGHEAELIDLLVDYDTSGVLSREVIEDIEPDASIELLDALGEVWRAASPLVAIGVAAAVVTRTPPSSPPTSTPRPRTAGRRSKSKTN